MSLVRGTNTKLDGPSIVHAFLGELHGYLYGAPDNAVDGTPLEIVEMVIEETDRFAGCSDECVQNLSRQLVMAVKAKGGRYHLQYSALKPLEAGRIRVALV